MMSNVYDFTLIYRLPERGGKEEYLDALFEAGCDDAIIGLGRPGYFAFDFEREAESAEAAMQSAIADIERAIPAAELSEAKPDYVSATDVADIMQCSRQNIRKHLTEKFDAPMPVMTGKVVIWHLSDVIPWLGKAMKTKIAEPLLELSKVAMKTNAGIEMKRQKK